VSKWERVKLGDVCEFINGDRGKNYPSAKDFKDEGIPFINAGHLVNKKIDFSEMNYINKTTFDKLGSGKIQKNDIFYCLRGSLGKNAISNIDTGAIASSLVLLRCGGRLEPRFLLHCIDSRDIEMQQDSSNTGSSQPNLSATNVKAYSIPLPPIDEQKKIAEILDKASNLISLRKKQIGKMDLLVKANFINIFGDIEINEKNWNVGIVNDVIDSITPGWSGNGEARAKREDEKAVLKVSAVTRGIFNANEYKVLDSNIRIKKYIYPQKGDLLFSRANTRELVGATCIIYEDYPDLLLPDKLWKLLFNNKANVFYMKYILSEPWVRSNISAQSTGTSGSMYNVSMYKLKNIEIPVPPIDLQNQFADFALKVNKQKAKLQQGLEKLELTYKALMQQYFG